MPCRFCQDTGVIQPGTERERLLSRIGLFLLKKDAPLIDCPICAAKNDLELSAWPLDRSCDEGEIA